MFGFLLTFDDGMIWVVRWSIWEPFGRHLGTIWAPFGNHLGAIWAPFWAPLQIRYLNHTGLLGHLGTSPEPSGAQFGSQLGPLWNLDITVMGYGLPFGQPQASSWPVLPGTLTAPQSDRLNGAISTHLGAHLMSFWRHSWPLWSMWASLCGHYGLPFGQPRASSWPVLPVTLTAC